MGLKVLIVEDEALVAMLIEDMLAELGHQAVGAAGRLSEALELARTQEADLALLDVNLNGEHTHAVADILRGRGVPVVFATGYGSAGLKDYPDVPVVQKPFELPDLARAIAAATKNVSGR